MQTERSAAAGTLKMADNLQIVAGGRQGCVYIEAPPGSCTATVAASSHDERGKSCFHLRALAPWNRLALNGPTQSAATHSKVKTKRYEASHVMVFTLRKSVLDLLGIKLCCLHWNETGGYKISTLCTLRSTVIPFCLNQISPNRVLCLW